MLLRQEYAQKLNCYYESTKDKIEYSAEKANELSGYRDQIQEKVKEFEDRLANKKIGIQEL